MGKGKPRHDPKKRQNQYGNRCPIYEEIPRGDGTFIQHCERWESNVNDVITCGGNRHNCVKTKYKRMASRSDKRKIYDGIY